MLRGYLLNIGEMTTMLTDDARAAIVASLADYDRLHPYGIWDGAPEDVRALLDDRAALVARVAALEAALQEIADLPANQATAQFTLYRARSMAKDALKQPKDWLEEARDE